MATFTKHLVFSATTTDASATTVSDRSNMTPIKWFSLTVDEDAYIGINVDADNTCLLLKAGESYTTPEKVRVFKVSVMRYSSNVTVRGSAWY